MLDLKEETFNVWILSRRVGRGGGLASLKLSIRFTPIHRGNLYVHVLVNHTNYTWFVTVKIMRKRLIEWLIDWLIDCLILNESLNQEQNSVSQSTLQVTLRWNKIGEMKLNGLERQKLERGIFLTLGEAWTTIFWPVSGFAEVTINYTGFIAFLHLLFKAARERKEMRESMRERETERDRQTDRERERQRQRDWDWDSEIDKERLTFASKSSPGRRHFEVSNFSQVFEWCVYSFSWSAWSSV